MHFGFFHKSNKVNTKAMPLGNQTKVAEPLYQTTERLIREMRQAGEFNSYREVVVIIPSGVYLDPKELGRYDSSIVAYKILESFPDVEFKMFYLDTGEEVHKQ